MLMNIAKINENEYMIKSLKNTCKDWTKLSIALNEYTQCYCIVLSLKSFKSPRSALLHMHTIYYCAEKKNNASN